MYKLKRKTYQKNKRYAYYTAAGVVLCSTALSQIPAYALTFTNATQSYRNQVIATCGITDSNDLNSYVTRSDFAVMLINASSYKDSISATSTVAAANDVPGTDTNSGYIRAALRNGLMRTKLGGNFEPNSYVTLNDASKAVLTLLGYTEDDYGTDAADGRLSLFKSLDLDDGISASSLEDTLTKLDCINIFYNLLKTNSKNSSSIYGTVLNVSLSDDGEIDATTLVEDEMDGPVLVRSVDELESTLPFSMDEARFYYNGTEVSGRISAERYFRSQINRSGWLVVYYSESSKTVWAYGTNDGSSDLPYYCIYGKVNAIYYTSSNITTPSSVLIGGTEYELSGSDVKFMFSVNGEISVGDYVIIICQENETYDSDGEYTYHYYCVGVLKYDTANQSTVVYSSTSSRYDTDTGTYTDNFGNSYTLGDDTSSSSSDETSSESSS